jgi:hypothetical protein
MECIAAPGGSDTNVTVSDVPLVMDAQPNNATHSAASNAKSRINFSPSPNTIIAGIELEGIAFRECFVGPRGLATPRRVAISSRK